jgi:predicted ATPase
VSIRYFKRFDDIAFDLSDHVILAGPNNSGKTTLLQAVVVWNLALQRWKVERPRRPKARQRSGVPITRKDFTAIPLRDMKALWTNMSTAMGKDEAEAEEGKAKAGYPRVMEIAIEGKTHEKDWKLAFEFRCQSSEQIYIKPGEEYLERIPPEAEDFNVVHVPPFSGIGTEETRYDRAYQDLLIGQGKPGDIIRNLLREVFEMDQDRSAWNNLCGQVERVFGYRLLDPKYEHQPYIVCEYLPEIPPKNKGSGGPPHLDVAYAGSGFHQVLMLLAFFYARPSSVLLLDEPDAHQHIILQKQTYESLRRVASRRKCQLIIATHSEVIIDGTSPEQILSFYSKPHRLVTKQERSRVHQALRRLSATDLLLAEQSPGVLYVEGETDFTLLASWARVLNHPLREWFEGRPFWHSNQGRHPREARDHFFAIRAVTPGLNGFLLLDSDNRDLPLREVRTDGLTVERWTRYEAESYLMHPEALMRFIADRVGGDLFAEPARRYLQDNLPPVAYRDPLGDHDYLTRTPVSKSLLPELLSQANLSLGKSDYYLIADQMLEEEIPAEVGKKLDAIARAFQIVQ